MKKKSFLFVILVSVVLAAACGRKSGTPDYWPTGDWKTSSPEAQGIDSGKLAAAMDPLLKDPSVNLHSLLVIRNGYIVAEYYSPPHTTETLHNLHSATKSFTSTLMGIAVTRKLVSVDRKVLSFFPDQTFENMSEWKRKMTIKHLLMMGSGLNWSDFYSASFQESAFMEMHKSDDWVQSILDRKVITKPGTTFNYNTGNSHLLSVILGKVVKQPLRDFTRENLFEPLGIVNYVWYEDPAGIQTGGTGLQLCPRDMAKLGYLYLNNGVWDGKRLLSKKWVREATTTKYRSEGNRWYGYQFWINRGFYNAQGAGGQYINIIPEKNLLIVMTGNNIFSYQELINPVYTDFSQAMEKAVVSEKSLPDNPSGLREMNALLTNLSTEKRIPAKVPSGFKNLESRKIRLDRNPFGLTGMLIRSIGENTAEVEFFAGNPANGSEESAVYTVGIDHIYRINSRSGYPLSLAHVFPVLKYHYPDPENLPLLFRGTFPDEHTLSMDYLVPGSLIRADITLELTEEGPFVYWGSSRALKGFKIRGRL